MSEAASSTYTDAFSEQASKSASVKSILLTITSCIGIRCAYALQFFVVNTMFSGICHLPTNAIFIVNACIPIIGLIVPPIVGFLYNHSRSVLVQFRPLIIIALTLTEVGLFITVIPPIIELIQGDPDAPGRSPDDLRWYDIPQAIIPIVGIVLMDIGLNIMQMMVRSYITTTSLNNNLQSIDVHLLYTIFDGIGLLICATTSVLSNIAIVYWYHATEPPSDPPVQYSFDAWSFSIYYISQIALIGVVVFITFFAALFATPFQGRPSGGFLLELKDLKKELQNDFSQRKSLFLLLAIVFCGWAIYSPFQSMVVTFYSFCSITTKDDSFVCLSEQNETGFLFGQIAVFIIALSQTLSPLCIRVVESVVKRNSNLSLVKLNTTFLMVFTPPLLILFTMLILTDYFDSVAMASSSLITVLFVGPFYAIINSFPYSIIKASHSDNDGMYLGLLNSITSLAHMVSNLVLWAVNLIIRLSIDDLDDDLDIANSTQITAAPWCMAVVFVMFGLVIAYWCITPTTTSTPTLQPTEKENTKEQTHPLVNH